MSSVRLFIRRYWVGSSGAFFKFEFHQRHLINAPVYLSEVQWKTRRIIRSHREKSQLKNMLSAESPDDLSDAQILKCRIIRSQRMFSDPENMLSE